MQSDISQIKKEASEFLGCPKLPLVNKNDELISIFSVNTDNST